jgi:hypothetical protein
MQPVFRVSHIYKGQATFKTKGLYRVIYHNLPEEEFTNDELLSLKEACRFATYWNSEFEKHPDPRKPWAEAISYKDWVKREKEQNEKEYRDIAVRARLKEIEEEKAAQRSPGNGNPTEPLIKVLEVGNGIAQVSTAGLVKVVIQPEGDVVRELYDPQLAKAFVNSYNASGGKTWAEIVSYPQ